MKPLTPRQVQIARMIGEGCSPKEVSARLDISLGTVRVHIARIAARIDHPGPPLRRIIRWHLTQS